MGPSHYLNQPWNIVNWTILSKLQWNLNRNFNIFIQENAFDNVAWKMVAILSRPQCVKWTELDTLSDWSHCWVTQKHLHLNNWTMWPVWWATLGLVTCKLAVIVVDTWWGTCWNWQGTRPYHLVAFRRIISPMSSAQCTIYWLASSH